MYDREPPSVALVDCERADEQRPPDPESIARHLHGRDPSAAMFGIELVSAAADGAVVRMVVRPEMCNGHEIVHGGITFLLADSAMAFASNCENEVALATSAQIDWLAPATVGQLLTATATRRWTGGRSTIWDIAVTTDDGTPIGLFRGTTRKVGRPVLPPSG